MDKHQTGMDPVIKHQTGMYPVTKHQMGMHQMAEHKTVKHQMGPRLHQRHIGDPRHIHQCPRQGISNTSRDSLESLLKKKFFVCNPKKCTHVPLRYIHIFCEPELVWPKLQSNYNLISRALHFPLGPKKSSCDI